MSNVQEDVSEKVLRLMIRVPQISARMMVAALRYLLRKLEEKEPVGLQKMNKLISQNNTIGVSEVTTADISNLDADMKVFDKIARQYGVGYSVVKDSGQPGYTVFYRAKNKAQYEKCLSEFIKYQQMRDFKMPDYKEPEKPLEGEIEYSTDIAVSERRETKKPDIIIETSMVVRRGTIADRLEWAKQAAENMNVQLSMEHQMGKILPAKELDINR